mmetsp:Transcript_35384/g.85368  ORF Transcript_35384/g.85368 Transcript_35384/m.85368 type:complete len:114 (-) Transcript_35384:2205-2546(-)
MRYIFKVYGLFKQKPQQFFLQDDLKWIMQFLKYPNTAQPFPKQSLNSLYIKLHVHLSSGGMQISSSDSPYIRVAKSPQETGSFSRCSSSSHFSTRSPVNEATPAEAMRGRITS